MSLSCAYMHWHRTRTGKFGLSSSSYSVGELGATSNRAWSWNFSPPPSSETHHMTLRFEAFQTPPGGDVVSDSPSTSGGTPMMMVRSIKLSSLWGLELICRATLQWLCSWRTRVWTRCTRIEIKHTRESC